MSRPTRPLGCAAASSDTPHTPCPGPCLLGTEASWTRGKRTTTIWSSPATNGPLLVCERLLPRTPSRKRPPTLPHPLHRNGLTASPLPVATPNRPTASFPIIPGPITPLSSWHPLWSLSRNPGLSQNPSRSKRVSSPSTYVTVCRKPPTPFLPPTLDFVTVHLDPFFLPTD